MIKKLGDGIFEDKDFPSN